MKQGKRPTRRQKILLKKWRLNPANWLVTTCTNEYMVVVHRHTDTVRRIPEGIA